MKFILKDGTEVKASSFSYSYNPSNEAATGVYMLHVPAETDFTDQVENLKSLFTEDNLSGATLELDNGHIYRGKYKRLSGISASIQEVPVNTISVSFM